MSIELNEDLLQYILEKIIWASSHRNCEAGAHDNIFREEEGRSHYADCPTERMFKLWYTTLIESNVMTQNDIEKYLVEEKNKNK